MLNKYNNHNKKKIQEISKEIKIISLKYKKKTIVDVKIIEDYSFQTGNLYEIRQEQK